ncbi:MAG: tetratricopeptide repeat protein [Candidatus Electrothrix sp. AX2]|nr:tetratricopeptide repeat protein [Candidatus Electrothrix gigas]
MSKTALLITPVVPIDWAQQGCQEPKQLLDWLVKHRRIKKKQFDLLAELVDSFNLDKSPIVSTNLTVFILSNLPNAINLGKKLLTACSISGKALPDQNSMRLLRYLLESILPDRNLILHICNADTLDLGMAGALLHTCTALDNEARAEQRHGRLLLALSCLPATRPVDLLACRRDRITLVYVDNDLSEQNLRESLDRNFSPNHFEEDLIAALHFYGKAKREDRLCSAARVATAVGELLEKNLLIWDNDCWQFNPYRAEQNFHTVIGIPLSELYQKRLTTLPSEMQEEADRFMVLAALCRQWIPQQLLLDYMGLDEDRGDLLIDSLDTAFVDTEPALLIDEQYGYPGFPELAIYRFAVPLLAVSLLSGDMTQEAEKLLAFLEPHLPGNNQTATALGRQLAEQAGPKVQERWQKGLMWRAAPEQAAYFSDMLLAKLHAGLVSVDYLLTQANEEKERQSIWLFKAVISACDRWYQEQGGVPSNQTGGLFLYLFGMLLDDLGQYQDALQKYEEALKLNLQVYPPDHPNIAASLNSIGSTLGELGRHEEALKKQEAALEMMQKVLPKDHPNIATSLNNIGLILEKLGRHEEALKKEEAALEIRQKVLPPDHPDIAISLNNIGSTLGELGRHEEALKKQEAALEIRRKVLPKDHPNIASSLNNIGSTLGELGRQEEALKKKEAALEIRQKVLPKDHPDIASSLNNIGSTLADLGRHEEALKKQEAALEMRQRILPEEHPDIALSLNNIGSTLRDLGRHEEALKKAEAALEILQKVLPQDHPDIALSLNNIGYTLGELGRHEEALKKQEAALEMQERLLPADHPHIETTCKLLKQCQEKIRESQ